MWRFCNDDRSLLRNGGRKAPLITESKFKDLIKKYVSKFDCDDSDDYNYALLDILLNEMEHKDLNVLCSTENIIVDNSIIKNNLLGIHTLKNGLVILGAMVGGDWEEPLFLCVYHDGKSFRLYIPHYGNTFNLTTKSAFGSEQDGPGYLKYEKVYNKFYAKYQNKILTTNYLTYTNPLTDEDAWILLKQLSNNLISENDYFRILNTYNCYNHNLNPINPNDYTFMYGGSMNVYNLFNESALEEDICSRVIII